MFLYNSSDILEREWYIIVCTKLSWCEWIASGATADQKHCTSRQFQKVCFVGPHCPDVNHCVTSLCSRSKNHLNPMGVRNSQSTIVSCRCKNIISLFWFVLKDINHKSSSQGVLFPFWELHQGNTKVTTGMCPLTVANVGVPVISKIGDSSKVNVRPYISQLTITWMYPLAMATVKVL